MSVNLIKKIIFSISICILLNCELLFANNVQKIDILVDLNDDGSARISQSWDGTFNEGTECYIPIKIDSNDILDFNVSLNDRQYTFINDWDVNNSFNNKSYRCGINKQSNPIELCFGISKYGRNKYVFSYTIKDFVKSYIDYDGFNFMLLNPSLSIYPSKVDCVVRMSNGVKLSSDNSAMWAYGLEGDIQFDNGYIHAKSNSLISNDDHLILVISLKKGIIYPKVYKNEYFEDVVYEANRGSDYEHYYYENDYHNTNYDYNNDDNSLLLYNILFYGIIALTFIFLILNNAIKIYQKKKFYKNCDYFRDIPNNKDLAMTYALVKDFSNKGIKETNVFGALLMQMIFDGNLQEDTTTKFGFFGREKKITNLVLKNEPTEEFKKRLYTIIKEASNGNDILEENEFSNYASYHFTELNDFLKDFYNKGRNTLSQTKCYKKAFSSFVNDLSDIGKAQLQEAIGLKKFLEDFSLIDEREIKDVSLWDSYLIYATLFGVADKVIKQMKKVYPEELIDNDKLSMDYLETSYIFTRAFNNMIIRNFIHYHHSNQSMFGSDGFAGSIGGFGGSISSGGGGGFSGGGFGGGTR